MTINVREIAFRSIEKVMDFKGYSDDVVNEQKKNIKDIRDFNLLRKLVFGVLERKYSLDFVIGEFSNTKFNRIDKRVLIILELAIYQILYLDLADYAAINESVDLVKKQVDPKLAGFVNGILRNVLRKKSDLLILLDQSRKPEIKYNIPLDIYLYFKESYPESYKDILQSFYTETDLTINVLDKKDLDCITNELERANMSFYQSNITDACIKIPNPKEVHKLDVFKNGLITIQGEGSVLAAQELNVNSGELVLDLCAAPGSKSIILAKTGAEVYLNDLDSNRNQMIEENFERTKLSFKSLTNFDASELREEWVGKFDKILADLPCTCLGLISRKPEIRYRRSLDDIKESSLLQKRILENAVKYLKKDGILIYSTCTYGKYENEDNTEYINSLGLKSVNLRSVDSPSIQLMGHKDKADGFYISKHKK